MAERSIEIKIIGDATKAKSTFTEAGQAADTFGGKIEGANSKWGTFGAALGGVVAAGALQKVGGFLLDGAKGAAEDAQAMDALRTSVENTGSSYDSYAKQIDDAIKRGQDLAFTDGETAQALQTLTDGTGSAEEALARLGTVQDFARAKNISLNDAAKLFAKVSDENTTALRRYGLAVEDGASAQDLLNAADAKFGGQAATFAESDSAKWLKMQQQVGELQEQLGGMLIPILALLVTGLSEVMTALQPVMDAFALMAAGDWAAGWEILSEVLSNVGDVLQNEVLPAILTGIQTFIDDMLPVIVEKLGELGLAFVSWVAPQIVPLLVELGLLYIELEKWLLTEALPKIIEKLLEWGKSFVSWVAPQVLPMLAELGLLYIELEKWLLTDALPKIVEKLLEWAASFVAWVAPAIPPLLVELGQLLIDVNDWILTTALPEIIAKLVEWGTAFLGWIAKDVLPTLPSKLGEIYSAIFNWIGSAAGAIETKLEEWVTKFLGWVADVVTDLPGKMADILSEIGTWVSNNASAVAGKAGDMASDFVNGFSSWVYNNASGIISAVIQWIKDQIPSWKDIGNSLLPGNPFSADAVNTLNTLGGSFLEDPIPPIFNGSPGVGSGSTPATGTDPIVTPPPYTTLVDTPGSSGRGSGMSKGASAGVAVATIPAADMNTFARVVAVAVEAGVERGIRRALSGAI